MLRWRSLGTRNDLDPSDKCQWLVRVLAGTTFVRAGEVEEALEMLGLRGETRRASLRACGLLSTLLFV